MLHGTPAQQEKYLPQMLSGETIWGMGYSEPDSGSDLASLKTTAVHSEKGWVINGQKIWTTTYWGQYMFVAARTDPHAQPQHKGISLFIVPTDAPGLQIRPTATMYSGTFANVFYEDVVVPDDALIGEVNDGWMVLTSALATERGLVGGHIAIRLAWYFEVFCEYLRHAERDGRPLRDDPKVRGRVRHFRVELGEQIRVPLHGGALQVVRQRAQAGQRGRDPGRAARTGSAALADVGHQHGNQGDSAKHHRPARPWPAAAVTSPRRTGQTAARKQADAVSLQGPRPGSPQGRGGPL
jgi:alkylation response protein AidB-like acyl-CoA dehydrogenase